VTAFRHGYVNGRQLPGPTGNYRELTIPAPGRVCPGQGLFLLVVAGVGFEPT
jgi:hypothetical protein